MATVSKLSNENTYFYIMNNAVFVYRIVQYFIKGTPKFLRIFNSRANKENSALTDSIFSFAAYMSPYLTIWAENVAFVYDTTTAEWLQTIPLKRVKPLCRDGSIGLSYVSDIPRLVYFRNVYHGKSLPFPLTNKERSSWKCRLESLQGWLA